jgi:DNA-binding response OmpR family regulator
MPGAGDGLTVVSAMRHTQPNSVTLLLSADPNLVKASSAIVSQVDEVILKPAKASFIVQRIRERLQQRQSPAAPPQRPVGPALEVADLIESEEGAIARTWLAELERPARRVPVEVDLAPEERTEHLPEALRDIVFRLRYPQAVGASTLFSMSALQHGARRRRQGVGAVTLAEEARSLQVALFRAIQSHRGRIDAAELPEALMAIADEVNAQLLQALEGFENEEPPEPQWGFR